MTLNNLKHGCYAGRLFRSHLLLAHQDVALYDWMYRQVCHHFGPVGKREWAGAEGAARQAWRACRRARLNGFAGRVQAAHLQFGVVEHADSGGDGGAWEQSRNVP